MVLYACWRDSILMLVAPMRLKLQKYKIGVSNQSLKREKEVVHLPLSCPIASVEEAGAVVHHYSISCLIS